MSEPPQKKILKVFDQDGLYKTMVVEPKTTAGEVCEKLGKKLFMKDGEMELFNLFVFEGGVKQSLKMTDFPFDLIMKFDKKEYKFYFLNIKGEFMSFQERVASSLTAAATGGAQKPSAGGATSPSLHGVAPGSGSPATGSPKIAAIKPGRGMSGYLLRKKAGKFFKVWCVANSTALLFYSSQEDKEPQMELVLENSIIELKANEQGAHILLTLANSERHTLMAENQGDLQAWATELAAAAAYSTVQQRSTMSVTPSMAFVPTTKDLGHVKLQGKLENIETQSMAFNRWTEYLVGKRAGITHTNEVTTCYSDGCVLINVIDALFERQIKFRKGKSVYEMQHNIDQVLETLKSLGADYGKLIATDIVDCKVSRVILRVLWSIFISFTTNGEKEYVAKERLIGWCGRKTLEVSKSIIVDSPTALFNPLAFAALISRHQPNLIDIDSLSKKSKTDQAQIVLDVANEHLKIPKLLNANCWTEDHADERSFMIYLSFFYFYLSGENSNKATLLKKCLDETKAVESESIVSARDKQLKEMMEQKEEEKKAMQARQQLQQNTKPPTTTPTPAPTSGVSKPVAKPLAKPIAKPLPSTSGAATIENSSKPVVAKPMAKPIAKPLPSTTGATNTTTAKPSAVPRTSKPPAPVRSGAQLEEKEKQDAAKIAKEKARKEAEEKAERLANQLEMEMLENEIEDNNEALEEQRRREQEDAAEMAELEELERLQREEFEREAAAKRFQQQYEEQKMERERAEREEQDRLDREEQERLEMEEREEIERLEREEREEAERLQREEEEEERRQHQQQQQQNSHKKQEDEFDKQHQDILDTLAGIDDELDMILRRETDENMKMMAMMEIHTNNQKNSNNTNIVETPIQQTPPSQPPSSQPPQPKILNERASIMNVFDKLDDQLSSSRNNSFSYSEPQQHQQQPQQDSNPSSKSGSLSSPTASPRPSETNNTNLYSQPPQSPPPQPQSETQQQPDARGKVVVRICLEGFGDVLFCSFAIGYDTLCGKVRQMVCKKMKVASEFELEYALYIVRDGLERILEDDEVLLEAEDKIDRFVFKLSDNFDRRSIISNHRG